MKITVVAAYGTVGSFRIAHEYPTVTLGSFAPALAAPALASLVILR